MLPEASVAVLGVLQFEEIELRCVREDFGWRPYQIRNCLTGAVTEPRVCFHMRPEDVQALDRAMARELHLN